MNFSSSKRLPEGHWAPRNCTHLGLRILELIVPPLRSLRSALITIYLSRLVCLLSYFVSTVKITLPEVSRFNMAVWAALALFNEKVCPRIGFSLPSLSQVKS